MESHTVDGWLAIADAPAWAEGSLSRVWEFKLK